MLLTQTSTAAPSILVGATCLAECAQVAGRQQVQATSESETKRFCLVTVGAGAYGGCHGVMAVLHSGQVAALSMGYELQKDGQAFTNTLTPIWTIFDFPILRQSDRQILNSVLSWEVEIFQSIAIINKSLRVKKDCEIEAEEMTCCITCFPGSEYLQLSKMPRRN